MENLSTLSNIIKFKPNGDLYISKGKNVLNVETYSIGNYSDVEALKMIKKTFNQNSEDSTFIKTKLVPQFIKHVNQINTIDVIVYPQSSSGLLSHFARELNSKLPHSVLLGDSFVKSLPSEIFIDSGEIGLDVKTLKRLNQIIENADTNGHFELKKVPLQFRKFFKGYLSLSTSKHNFIDKNVLVVDDVLSSGATISEIYRILKLNGANNIIGVTLFKKNK